MYVSYPRRASTIDRHLVATPGHHTEHSVFLRFFDRSVCTFVALDLRVRGMFHTQHPVLPSVIKLLRKQARGNLKLRC